MVRPSTSTWDLVLVRLHKKKAPSCCIIIEVMLVDAHKMVLAGKDELEK